MEYKLNAGEQSNYEIVLEVGNDEMENFKESVLKEFQKNVEVSWFRKWHVPLNIVEQNVKPDYLKMGLYEEAINKWLKKIMDENPDIQFIWNIYDLNQEEKDDKVVLNFKLDVYPEAKEQDEKWQDISMEKVDSQVWEEEVNQTLDNIKKQHAEYKDMDEMREDTVAKVKIYFLDGEWQEIEKSTAFIWKEDLEEFSNIKESIVGKKMNEKILLDYKEDSLPPHLHYKKEGDKPSSVELELVEIKEEKLPEFTEEKIKELFQWEVNSLEELKQKIKETVEQQKWQQSLVKNVEDYINSVQKHIDVRIPATIVNEEFKSRMENLKQRFGWEEWFNKYLSQIWEEQKKKMNEDVRNASRDSLKKFFILRKVTEKLWIFDNINWQTQLEPEQKLYEKLVWESLNWEEKEDGWKEQDQKDK